MVCGWGNWMLTMEKKVQHDEHLRRLTFNWRNANIKVYHLRDCDAEDACWMHLREYFHYLWRPFPCCIASVRNFFLIRFQFCCLATTLAQYEGPPRLNIPGAIPLPALRPNQGGRAIQAGPVRVRRPNRPQPQGQTEVRFLDEAKPVTEEAEDEYAPQHQPAPPSPPRALFTNEPQEPAHQPEVQSNAQRFNIERPRPAQQQRNLPQPQPQRPRAQNFDEQRPHQKPHHSDDKPKKPVAQILRKYREENPDGSITWGFENDDGSFKEETIGVDCITRGIYGYIDPDGEKRVRNEVLSLLNGLHKSSYIMSHLSCWLWLQILLICDIIHDRFGSTSKLFTDSAHNFISSNSTNSSILCLQEYKYETGILCKLKIVALV